jgi:hypothetical protein
MTRQDVELVILDALEQVGSSAGDIDADTSLDALGLSDLEREDLASDFETELEVRFTSDDLRSAGRVGDLVDLVLARARSSSP